MLIVGYNGSFKLGGGLLTVTEACLAPDATEALGRDQTLDDPSLPGSGWVMSVIGPGKRPVSPPDVKSYESRGMMTRLPSPGIEIALQRPFEDNPFLFLASDGLHPNILCELRLMQHEGLRLLTPKNWDKSVPAFIVLFRDYGSVNSWTRASAQALHDLLLKTGEWIPKEYPRANGDEFEVKFESGPIVQARTLDLDNPGVAAMEVAVKLALLPETEILVAAKRRIEVTEITLSRNQLLEEDGGVHLTEKRLKNFRRFLSLRLTDLKRGDLASLIEEKLPLLKRWERI